MINMNNWSLLLWVYNSKEDIDFNFCFINIPFFFFCKVFNLSKYFFDFTVQQRCSVFKCINGTIKKRKNQNLRNIFIQIKPLMCRKKRPISIGGVKFYGGGGNFSKGMALN